MTTHLICFTFDHKREADLAVFGIEKLYLHLGPYQVNRGTPLQGGG